jgi:hypothetical protein
LLALDEAVAPSVKLLEVVFRVIRYPGMLNGQDHRSEDIGGRKWIFRQEKFMWRVEAECAMKIGLQVQRK